MGFEKETMGAFVQTSNFQWSDKTRKFLTKTGQRELSEWLSYMDFQYVIFSGFPDRTDA